MSSSSCTLSDRADVAVHMSDLDCALAPSPGYATPKGCGIRSKSRGLSSGALCNAANDVSPSCKRGPTRCGSALGALLEQIPRASLLLLATVLVAAAVFTSALTLAFFFPGTLRNCQPDWPTAADAGERPRIGLVTMRDDRLYVCPDALADVMGISRSPAPKDILSITWAQKAAYAAAHGYTLVNGSDLIDASRPPSWSKLLVVQSELARYDWVFYLDADTIITNDAVRLEGLLPANDGPDLVLTRDGGGVNAGAWAVRSSPWSAHFLREWWDSTSFIRRGEGDTKSGDNDALKAILAAMAPRERTEHVGVAPQCAFNSYLWRTSLRTLLRLAIAPRTSLQGIWRPGDFVLHFAGFKNKLTAMQQVMSSLAAPARPAVGRVFVRKLFQKVFSTPA